MNDLYIKGQELYNVCNYTEMEECFILASNQGHIDSMLFLAKYYYNILKYDEMLKYYLMALCIDNGNIDALFNLGIYYYEIEYYILMKKYWLMAIEKGDVNSMHWIGSYYSEVEDYTLMKKYYLLAYENGHIYSLISLAEYYNFIYDYNEMKKYCYLAINNSKNDNNCAIEAMYILGAYYHYNEKNYKEMKKMYLSIIYKGDNEVFRYLLDYYNMKKKYYINN